MTLRVIRSAGDLGEAGEVKPPTCAVNEVVEWTWKSGGTYGDPFSEVELDAVISGPDGRSQRVPAFWAGGDTWRVRYAPHAAGRYTLETVCSDERDRGLHGRRGELIATAYEGDNPLLRHGPLRAADDGRCLRYADGEPFLWLGDTWWLGLSQRFDWPETFQALVADRRSKGFNVIELLGGLFCDMVPHDPRGANEGGLAWEDGYARINPAFFDWADRRIDWLVAEGMLPCLFGAWTFYLTWMGVDRMEQHWRYLIARYGAYPVVWCLAGGGTMPYYLSEDREGDQEQLRRGWRQVAQYVRDLDPYHRILALHPVPRPGARSGLGDDVPNELPMRHVRNMIPEAHRMQRAGRPPMPLPDLDVCGDICYPDMLRAEEHHLHRRLFWSCMLSGAVGYTYGLNGLWQAGSLERPYGPSPNGHEWPNTPWDEAADLSSSSELGWAKALLEQYDWPAFSRHPGWVDPHATPGSLSDPFAAGIPGRVRLVYIPEPCESPITIRQLEPGVYYRARRVDPRDGHEVDLGATDGKPDWAVPPLPDAQDWLLVLERD